MEKEKIFNIPNILSAFRILLIPAFIYFFFKGDNYLYVACIILILSGITDMLDGYIARKFNKITQLGQLLDPIADKLTQATVAVCMIINYIEYIAITTLFALFILKEFTMLLGSIILVVKKKAKPTPAKWFGKVATVVFYISVVLIVLFRAIFQTENLWVTWSLVAITAIMFIIAFIGYAKVFVAIYNDKYDFEPDKPQNIMNKNN